jgi:hypothetical protein
LFYFLILALVFYNSRFSLFLLAMYIPCAIWPFTLKVYPEFMRWLFRGALVTLMVIVTLNGVSAAGVIYAQIRLAPVFLKEMGLKLGSMEPDKSQKVMARKPHVAYYAGLVPIMFPDKPGTVEELVAHARKQGIRYIVYTGVEAQARPNLQVSLLDLNTEKPGLKLVFYNQHGVVYRVE